MLSMYIVFNTLDAILNYESAGLFQLNVRCREKPGILKK